MEEEWTDTQVFPLFGETSVSHYMVKHVNRTVITFTRGISTVKDPLNQSNQLFADNLWPGCFVLADFLDSHPSLCVSKRVLELGAGSALPSLVAAVIGAEIVVCTDYPEESVIANIGSVMSTNKVSNILVLPHRWGDSVDSLLCLINNNTGTNTANATCVESTLKFELILLAELLWKDTFPMHNDLLNSIAHCLCKDNGIAVMTFVHRPTTEHTAEMDLSFFEHAREKFGLHMHYVGVNNKYKDVFEDDSSKYADVHMYLMYYDADISCVI